MMLQNMVIRMQFRTKLITALLMLLVLSGQVIAADDMVSCDMDMPQMAMMDHESMDCCANDCAMDCSLSLITMIIEASSFEAMHTSSDKIILSQHDIFIQTYTSLFRPPISA